MSRHTPGQALHRSWLALSLARVCRADLSTVFPRSTRADLEALGPDRAQARLPLVWQGQSLAEETLETCVSLVWDPAYEEPWLLISDAGAGHRQVQAYGWRMRVEAT